ncbi:gamma-butyrobetaine hydroxylase-like domain-containing protein [Colwellia sp. MSW7]|uniref:Gamma-butyrobetaine hydroxylase-like domain-containing protein n=1 Tax=Colwellia maritima TaxID=2912588 RepID=A0ABS9X459_9GAMM|nr:gamma-butyrobetaine hydroxylase-like domain-containing protein [Colwellia maritima]MCI2284850.1 gamma-butyrobetaine hydroxylase-like domain-containing protein [Colwellia maritima]
MRIKQFTINTNKKSITIHFVHGDTACLDFEYLRVFSPNQQKSTKQQTLVTNKKVVLLLSIENVGKHGFRFVFDDQHSAIYTTEYLNLLITEYEQRWQHYLAEIKNSGHSREAMIDITQL